MVPGIDGIDAFFVGLFLKLFYEALSDTVHTTYGGHNPYLISHTDITVLANIALEGSVLFLDFKFFVYRMICVLKSA